MNNEVKKHAERIQRFVFILYCFFFAGTLIAFTSIGYMAEKISLGILFFLTAVFHIYEAHHHFNNTGARLVFGLLSIVGILLGIISVASEIDLKICCLLFGIMDAASGLTEILTNYFILKRTGKTLLNITDYIVSVADIVFGIILIIKLENGLLIHVLYLSIVFIINGCIALFEAIYDLKHHG